ncbi:PhzF family phenazine biosynthesis protein [Actinoplanes regularis]|uniref:Phenazine biosynthesis protein PhzF family n=1 Tax=Actinoplanes regularis TaxID=52697 RepID=A0A238YWQ0_9ACTN|nr:PhzF family phenazine biosynthesis protein [Actinoplanes regularis]GIE85621.1 epimerase [Actinoplanes regularis]SNR75527.1 phenazine biosynthesis protein PhzF family [Actinoplanes regularis]
MTRFSLVDVFAERPLTGNPLAVVPDADDLTVPQMRAIAREFNQSETTFLLRPGEAGVDRWLRSFTPAGVEVDGAGHNALGAWLWLADQGLTGDQPVVTMHQRIGSEVLAVEVRQTPGEPARIIMDQGVPHFGEKFTDDERLAAALGLEPSHLSREATAQVVSTGAAHLLVPFATREAVDAAEADSRALAALLAEAGGEGCYLYTTAGGDGAAAYTRFFNPTVGIAEDPATGTAAGPLAVALVRSGRVPADAPVLIEQGHRLGHPSRIRIDVTGDRVRISGSGVITAHGELRLA